MKSKMRIKNIMVMAVVAMASMFFINMSLAATTGTVNVETANLREKANAESKILEQLSLNQEVEIIEKSGEWYQVKHNGITGYVKQDLIKANEEVKKEENTNEENTTQPTQQNNENETQSTEQNTEQKEDSNLGIHKVSKETKLKIVPSINATETIDVKVDEQVNVIEVINGWACVETQNTKGWIRQENLKSNEEQQNTENQTNNQVPEQQEAPQETAPVQETVIKTQYVNTATVNLRKEPSTDSEIVTSYALNTSVEVLSEANGWSKVKVSGKEGYISSSLLSDKKQQTSRGTETSRKTANTTNQASSTATNTNSTSNTTAQNADTTSNASGSATGASVVAYAKQFIGTKYTYGGSSPSTGFDCSGFTSYVYRHFGVSLPRTSGGQSGVGVAVNRANLAPGDLVIYSGHVAIYVGGGNVIHAPRPGKSVCIVPLSQAAGSYLGARRVI